MPAVMCEVVCIHVYVLCVMCYALCVMCYVMCIHVYVFCVVWCVYMCMCVCVMCYDAWGAMLSIGVALQGVLGLCCEGFVVVTHACYFASAACVSGEEESVDATTEGL